MYSFPTLSLFGDLVQPYRNQVIVISDSEYKKHQQAEARKQIEALETQAKTYRQYLTNAETTIAALQKEYDLLPEASPGKEQKE